MTLHLSGFAFVVNAPLASGMRGAGVGLDCTRIAEAIAPAVEGQAVNESWVVMVPLGQRSLPAEVLDAAEAARNAPVPLSLSWVDSDGCPDLSFVGVRNTVEGLRGLGLGTDALVVVRVG